MADNTQLAAMTGGDLCATDEIATGVAAGAKVQRVKTGYGADGSYVDVSSADPLPVAEYPTSSRATASAPAAVTIGTSAGVVLAARTTRRALLIQNVHPMNTLYLGFGANPTTANGIRIKAGDSYADTGFTGAVNGIADAAGTDIRVVEFD